MEALDPDTTRGLLGMAGCDRVDTFACGVIATELEFRLRQVISNAQSIQRRTMGPALSGEHVHAAISQTAVPVSQRECRC